MFETQGPKVEPLPERPPARPLISEPPLGGPRPQFPTHTLGGAPDRSAAWAGVRYGLEGLAVFATLFPSAAPAVDGPAVTRALGAVDRRGGPTERVAESRRVLWKAYVAASAAETAATSSLMPFLADPGVARYSAEVRDRLTLSYDSLDPAARGRLLELLRNDAFFGLDALTQLSVLRVHVDLAPTSAAAELIGTLAVSPGFGALGAGDRALLLRYVRGNDKLLSPSIRSGLESVLLDPTTKAEDAAGQAARLRDFVRKERGTPGVVPTWDVDFDKRRRPYTLSAPEPVEDYPFHTGKADGLRYTVSVGGRQIQLVASTVTPEAGFHVYTPAVIAKAIAALPASSLAELTTVEIDGKRSPEDKHWGALWKAPEFRAFMTAGDHGVVHVYPTGGVQAQRSVDGALIHETGHLWSRKAWGPDGSVGWKAYAELIKKDSLHPSHYAANNAAEDIAETIELYHIVRGTPDEPAIRALFPARFQLLDGVFGHAEAALEGAALALAG